MIFQECSFFWYTLYWTETHLEWFQNAVDDLEDLSRIVDHVVPKALLKAGRFAQHHTVVDGVSDGLLHHEDFLFANERTKVVDNVAVYQTSVNILLPQSAVDVQNFTINWEKKAHEYCDIFGPSITSQA